MGADGAGVRVERVSWEEVVAGAEERVGWTGQVGALEMKTKACGEKGAWSDEEGGVG